MSTLINRDFSEGVKETRIQDILRAGKYLFAI